MIQSTYFDETTPRGCLDLHATDGTLDSAGGSDTVWLESLVDEVECEEAGLRAPLDDRGTG